MLDPSKMERGDGASGTDRREWSRARSTLYFNYVHDIHLG